MAGRGYGGGERGRLYTYRYTVTTRMIPAAMGSDESHFNVSVGSDGQSHKKRKESRSGIEPRSFLLTA